jgi:hypothetical protein
MDMKRTCRCLCGAVVFEASLKDTSFAACHCGMCRKISGGAPFFAKDTTGLEVIAGTNVIATFKSSSWAERAHCRTCGSPLWYRLIPADQYIVAVGTFDDTSDFKLTNEIFVDCKAAGYPLADDTKKMTEAEFVAAFAPPE